MASAEILNPSSSSHNSNTNLNQIPAESSGSKQTLENTIQPADNPSSTELKVENNEVSKTQEKEIETSPAEKKEPESTKLIYEGYMFKRGLLPLRKWQKRYFVIPKAQKSFPLNNLRIVYNKNVKKPNASKKEFEKINMQLLETLATATVNTQNMIICFKTEKANEIPHALINLNHVVKVEAAPKVKQFAFVIKTKARDYILSTQSAQETESWIKTIKSILDKDITSYSNSEGYKASYEELVLKKAFTQINKSNDPQPEEILSASETELEPEKQEVTNTEQTPEKPSETEVPEALSKTETVENNQEPPKSPEKRKSYYQEVVNVLFKKGEKQSPVLESSAPAQVSEEPINTENQDKTEKTETEKTEIEDIEKNTEIKAEDKDLKIVENQKEVSPARHKSFAIPKIFNKDKDHKLLKKFFRKHEETENQENIKKEIEERIEEPIPVEPEQETVTEEQKVETPTEETTKESNEQNKDEIAPARKQTIMQRIGGFAKGSADKEAYINERIKNAKLSGELTKHSRFYKTSVRFCLLSEDGKFTYCRSKNDQGTTLDLKDHISLRTFEENKEDFELISKFRTYKFSGHNDNGQEWIDAVKSFVSETKEEPKKLEAPKPASDEKEAENVITKDGKEPEIKEQINNTDKQAETENTSKEETKAELEVNEEEATTSKQAEAKADN